MGAKIRPEQGWLLRSLCFSGLLVFLTAVKETSSDVELLETFERPHVYLRDEQVQQSGYDTTTECDVECWKRLKSCFLFVSSVLQKYSESLTNC